MSETGGRGDDAGGGAAGPGCPTDDRSGRRLNRRLAVAVPLGAAIGAGVGVIVVVAVGGWPVIPLLAGIGAATAGTIAGAIEDGRVQREIDRRRGTRRRGGGGA